MGYLMFWELKSILRQYFFSLNIKKIDYLIYFILTLIITLLFKIFHIFEVKLGYIIVFCLLVTIFVALQDRSKLFVNEVKSNQFNLTKMYPIKTSSIIILKMFKYEVLSFVEYISIIFPLFIILFLVGYKFEMLITKLILLIIIFLCTNRFAFVFFISISNYKNKFFKMLVGSIKIGSLYFFIHCLNIVFTRVVGVIDGTGDFSRKIVDLKNSINFFIIFHFSYIHIFVTISNEWIDNKCVIEVFIKKVEKR